MFECKIIDQNEALPKGVTTITIPGGENYPVDDPNFTNAVSCIMVETMISPDMTLAVKLGNSGTAILCTGIIQQGEAGIGELKNLANTLLFAMGMAVATPGMDEESKDYCLKLVQDANENGLDMPLYGKIPLN